MPERPLYWGYFRNNEIYRESHSLWFEPSYPICDMYVPYALGGGYVISLDLVALVVDLAASHNLLLLTAEDAWTSTVTSIVDLHRAHDIRFDTSHGRRDCASYYVVLHKRDADEQHAVAERLRVNATAVCEGPDPPDGPPVYAYDHGMRPSKCCSLFHFKRPDDPAIWDARRWPIFAPRNYPYW